MWNYNFVATSETEKFFNQLTPEAFVLIGLFVLLCLAVLVFLLVSQCLIFKKAGEKEWKGLIPLYSSWIETKIVGLSWYWFLIFVGTLAASEIFKSSFVFSFGLIIVVFNYNYNLAKKFGKSNGFAVLCTILPIIGLPILAFGDAKYKKDTKVDKNGIFSVDNF